MADTQQKLVHQMGLNADDWNRSAEKAAQSGNKLVNTATNITVSEEKVGRASTATATKIDRLEGSVDRVVRAEMARQRQLGLLDRALQEGIISNERYNMVVSKVDANFARSTRNLATGTNGFRAYRGAVQQAGYQVGDFAVQIASGQNAMVAFTQQGSQLLQVFGPLGAVLGAGLSIAGALALGLFELGKETDSVSKATKEAAKAQEAYNAIMLTGEERAAAAAKANRDLAMERAREEYRTIQAEVERITTELERAQRVEDDPNLRRGRLGPALNDNLGTGPRSNPIIQELNDQLDGALMRLGEVSTRMDDLADPKKSGKAREDEQDRLKKEREELEKLWIKEGEDIQKRDEMIAKAREAASKRALSVIQGDQQAARKVIQETMTPLEAYYGRLEDLNALYTRGLIDVETYSRALYAAGDAYRDVGSAAEDAILSHKQFVESVDRGFDTLIRSGGDWRSAMLSILADVQRAFFSQATGGGSIGSLLVNGIGSLFGATAFPSTPVPTGLDVGSITPGFAPLPRAEGGPVTAGQPYTVGEEGPELFVPGQSGAIVPNDKMGSSTVVNFNFSPRIDARGADKSVLPQINQIMKESEDRAVTKMLQAVSEGGQAAKIVGRRR